MWFSNKLLALISTDYWNPYKPIRINGIRFVWLSNFWFREIDAQPKADFFVISFCSVDGTDPTYINIKCSEC